jgi:hypothetical protein
MTISRSKNSKQKRGKNGRARIPRTKKKRSSHHRCNCDAMLCRVPSKIADGSTAPSLSWVSKSSWTQTAANSVLAAYIVPGRLDDSSFRAPVISAGVITNIGPGWNTTGYSHMYNDTRNFRVVASTLEVEYVGNDNTNGGIISVKAFTGDYGAANAAPSDSWPTSASDSCLPEWDGRASRGTYIIAQVNDSTHRKTYHNLGELVHSGQAYMKYLVLIEGADVSNQSWRFTLTQSLELLPEAGGLMVRMATPPAQDSPVPSQVLNYVQTSLESAGQIISEYVAKPRIQAAALKYAQTYLARMSATGLGGDVLSI